MKPGSGSLFRPLAAEQVIVMRDRAAAFLAQRGVRIDSDAMLDVLSAHGAEVESGTGVVRIPTALVDAALASAPSAVDLCALDSERDVTAPDAGRGFLFRTNTGAVGWLDPETGEHRRITSSDIAEWGRLADALDEVDFVAFPTPEDVPGATADVHALRTLLTVTGKHVWVQPYSAESVPFLMDLAVAAAGTVEKLRRRPPVSFVATSLTPFTFKEMDCDVILACCEHGIPIHGCSLPSAGGTSPGTVAGSTLVMVIEVLAMLILTQLVRPGQPFIGAPISFTMDMRNGRVVHGSPEAVLAGAAAVQVIREAFGVPTHTYGSGTDSPVLDAQAASEAAVQGTLIALAGADIVGGGGQLEVASSISLQQLVLDSERIGVLRSLLGGMEVDDEATGWEAMLAAEPAGSFIADDHTRRHCRDVWTPRVYSRDGIAVWQDQGGQDATQRAQEIVARMMAQPARPRLGTAALAAMDAIVRRADAALVT